MDFKSASFLVLNIACWFIIKWGSNTTDPNEGMQNMDEEACKKTSFVRDSSFVNELCPDLVYLHE